MRGLFGTLFFAAFVSITLPARAADEDPKAPLFAEPKKDWAWDEDKRFDFLIERLASLEASLDAVNAAIAKATGKKGAKLGEARRAEENNTLMDRKGGGPMKWDEFYGTNAEKFFYHPVDPNTTYRTETFLRQMGKGEDDKYDAAIPSRQSVPVHQRPPQFDYIYKANRDARDRAEEEAAKLAGKVETLTQRRIALEREQAELWCQLAFRAIQRLDIPRKPVLRFRLVSASSNTDDVQKAEALAAAARFLATALLIIDKAEDDQATALGNVKDIVTKARNDFDDALLNTDAVAEDVSDAKTRLGKYVALTKLLDDTSSNLSDSYEVAMEGDRADDRARKERFRGLLQKSLVEYAQIVLALDELTGVMKTDWKVKVDTKNKIETSAVSWPKSGAGDQGGHAKDLALDDAQSDAKQNTMSQKTGSDRLRRKFFASKVIYDDTTGVLTLRYDFKNADQLSDFDLSECKPAFAGKGTIRLSPGDSLPHVGRFVTGKIECKVKCEKVGVPFLSSGAYRLSYEGGYYTRIFRLVGPGSEQAETDVGPTEPVDGGEPEGVYAVSLTIGEKKSLLSVRGKNPAKECGLRAQPTDAISWVFDGNSNGITIADLEISGQVDADWLREFLSGE